MKKGEMLHENLDVLSDNFDSATTEKMVVGVYNLNGQVVYKTPVSEDLSNVCLTFNKLSKGIYFLRLREKEEVITEKLIVH